MGQNSSMTKPFRTKNGIIARVDRVGFDGRASIEAEFHGVCREAGQVTGYDSWLRQLFECPWPSLSL